MGASIGAVRSLFALPVGDPELARSQLAALSRQIPLLYVILTVNALALAATHATTAPWLLSLLMPGAMSLLCAIRLLVWRRLDVADITPAAALARLRLTTRITAGLGALFTAWSLSLFPYGDAYAQCHVAFYMSITVVSCILCLMHLRRAALVLTAVVVAPAAVFFLRLGNPVLTAMIANLIVVVAGLVFMMLRNYADFAALIVSRREVLAQQRNTQRLSDENLRLANIDSLTDLPNRRCFLAAVDAAILGAERDGTRFAVAMLDLDRFKAVNDVHGHGAGDRLLAEVGRRLDAGVAANSLVARLGGDEFGAIVAAGPSDAGIAGFGAAVRGALRPPCRVGEGVASVSCSIGVALYPEAGRTAAELFERADYALYHAKQTRTGELVVFSDHHETAIRAAGRLEQALRNADLDHEMWVVFQPIVDTATHRTVVFEALARWHNPDVGLVGPDQFIPIAERTQMVGRLTEALLAKALRAAAAWPASVGLSFNLSAQDLIAPATMATVRRMVIESGVAPQRIEFEITESAVLADFEQASAAIAAFHALGLRISLDDFGSGFSSLGHIHRLKPDKVKIDRSFLFDLEVSVTAAVIIRTIVDLCRNLGIDCVVEGVETEAQVRLLTLLGCRFFQGYVFSRPIPAEAVAALLASEQRADASPATGHAAARG